MNDASYVRKPVSEWTTETIRQWMYAIGARSDSVISEAQDTDDWSDVESDDRMYKILADELRRRNEKP